jgi:hypothetical protein
MTFLQTLGRFWPSRAFVLEQPTTKAHTPKPLIEETHLSFQQCLWYGVSRGATGNCRDDQNALLKRRLL